MCEINYYENYNFLIIESIDQIKVKQELLERDEREKYEKRERSQKRDTRASW